jgi:uncharacterized protein
VLVAFSGGVDSTLVCKVAHEQLGERMLAVTARSPVEMPAETEEAITLAERIGCRHVVVDVDDLADLTFVANPPDRCYHCKARRFRLLAELARQEGLAWLADGTNADDADVYRPGRRALAELGVRSPLAEAGLTKADIRALSHALDLPTWDKPSAPCLATRFPYGTQITRQAVTQVAEAETYLHDLGFNPVRVRYHENLARIEVEPKALPRAFELREKIAARLRELGFAYVTLDLIGYRSGSMDEVL